MTELRKRIIECLQLRGLSERTQEAYVRAVRQLAEHYHTPPDHITEEELRQYFLYLKNVKKYSRAATTIALCGIKFFFERTLEKEQSSSLGSSLNFQFSPHRQRSKLKIYGLLPKSPSCGGWYTAFEVQSCFLRRLTP